jgi:hypothetical protein
MRTLPVKQRLTIPQSTNVEIGIDMFDTMLGPIGSPLLKSAIYTTFAAPRFWSVGCFQLCCRKTHVGDFCHS